MSAVDATRSRRLAPLLAVIAAGAVAACDGGSRGHEAPSTAASSAAPATSAPPPAAPSSAVTPAPARTAIARAAASDEVPAWVREAPTAAPSAPAAPEPGSAVFDPVVGLPSLPVGEIARRDVEAKLGPPAEIVSYGTWSTSLVYPQGIEATFCQGDRTEIIRYLKVHAPFKAHLANHDGSRAVVLGKTTLRQVRPILGEKPWTSSDGSPVLSWIYDGPRDRSLTLSVARDLSLPQQGSGPQHLDRPIVAFMVSIQGTNCPKIAAASR